MLNVLLSYHSESIGWWKQASIHWQMFLYLCLYWAHEVISMIKRLIISIKSSRCNVAAWISCIPHTLCIILTQFSRDSVVSFYRRLYFASFSQTLKFFCQCVKVIKSSKFPEYNFKQVIRDGAAHIEGVD